MRLGKLEEKSVEEIGMMEEVKQKAIELLLGVISKEGFEMMLYEKVKTEDVIKNEMLFDLVNINYRKNSYKNQLFKILEEFVTDEAFIIYKVNLYSSNIKDENDNNIIYKNFNKIYGLFEYDKDYTLMWDFYQIDGRIDLIEIKQEKVYLVFRNTDVGLNRSD